MNEVIYIAVHSTRARYWKYQGGRDHSVHSNSFDKTILSLPIICSLWFTWSQASCARFEVLQVPFTINVNVLTKCTC